MQRLFPPVTGTDASGGGFLSPDGGQPSEPGAKPGPEQLAALAEHYAYPEDTSAARPWVRANMVTGLDGAAWFDGVSRPLSGPADMRIFGVLRALADVVVVGAETVRGEGYQPCRARPEFAAARAARGQAPAPAIAVVTRRADLDFAAPLFTAAAEPTLLVTVADAPAERLRRAEQAGAVVLVAGDGPSVRPADAVAALAARGLVRQLTEGGPRLLGRFVADDAVDELCLTVSPTLTSGTAERIAHGPSTAAPHPMRLAGMLEEDGFLFTRYLRDRPDGTRAAG